MFGNHQYSRCKFHPVKIVFFVLVFTAIVSALGWVVMFLWNHILVDTVGVRSLTYWKALGLLVLAKILFGGIGRRPGRWRNAKRNQWRKKWMRMSDEERREFKSRWKERCRRRESGKKEDEAEN